MSIKCYRCKKEIPEAQYENILCNDCNYERDFVKCRGCYKSYHRTYFDNNQIDLFTNHISDYDIKEITNGLMRSCFCYHCALNESYIIWNKYKKN